MKKVNTVKDNSERYLLTYADLMNLLLILFIVLYAASKTDVQKAQQVAEAVRKGFNASETLSSAMSPTSEDTTSVNENTESETDYSEFYDKLVALIKQAGMANQVEVTADSNDVVITLRDTAFFESGSAELGAQAHNLMYSIGGLITQVNYALILVEGYTDSDPISTTQFPDNRELSTARANCVYRVLNLAGIPAEKIASVGFGETNPIASNDTSSNKSLNRRVVLTIYKSTNGLTPQEEIAAKDLLGNSDGVS